MIQFKVTDNKGGQPKTFQFEESLAEVTLRRFIDFKEKIEANKPESLIKWESIPQEEKESFVATLPIEEVTGKWNDYTIDFVKYWTGMTDDVISHMPIEDIHYVYRIINNYFSNINIDEKATSFDFDGNVYLFPEAPVNPYSDKKDFLKSNRMVDIVESMQFELFSSALGESKWSVLPSIIAILFKIKDEELPIKSADREAWIAKRAKLFEVLPVEKALNAAFFLLRRKNTYGNGSSQYSIQHLEAFPTQEQRNSGVSMDGTQPLSKLPNQDSSILVA